MDNEFRDVESDLEPEPRPFGREEREGIPWGAVLLLLWAIALIVFSVQNADDTAVAFLGWEWRMPVALLVMVTALATMVLSAIVSTIYRRRRRKRRRETQAGTSDE